jgi:flagellar assembly protein FliH
MAVIKAGTLYTPQPVAFNFEDLQAQASRYIAEIRKEAASILQQARKEAETIKQNAFRQGHQEGLAAAQAEAAEKLRQKVAEGLQTALPLLRQALEQLEIARQTQIDHWQKACLHVAVEIARRIVRKELSRDPQIPLRWIQEALDLAAGAPAMELRLHPKDYEFLRESVTASTAGLKSKFELVPDPTLSPGSCRLETRYGMIDTGWEAQLARLEEELL